MEPLRFEMNQVKDGIMPSASIMGIDKVSRAAAFFKSIPLYRQTPLYCLPEMAAYLGVASIYVKDESRRFGLNAFKALGGAYAMARYIAQKAGAGDIDWDTLISDEVRGKVGSVTFFTATDGNHGRGVAWAASKLRQKSVVYMPAGSTQHRLQRIRNEGADASITDLNYDDAVRLASEHAANTPGGVVVQDTAWEGYEEIPRWIMQGYGVMAAEADRQMGVPPTHILVQAGVGSLAGAITGFFTNLYPNAKPKIGVVEASNYDCLYRSALAGQIRRLGGHPGTIMAGLACGEPNTIAWDILHDHADCFISAPDYMAVQGMRMYSSPLGTDPRVISGESGAVTLGVLAHAMLNMKILRAKFGLDEHSRVLLFSTEGDTDPQRYLDIVWGNEVKL